MNLSFRYPAVVALILAAAPFAAKADQISIQGTDVYCVSAAGCTDTLGNGTTYNLNQGDIQVLGASVGAGTTTGILNNFANGTVTFSAFNYLTSTSGSQLFTISENGQTLIFDVGTFTYDLNGTDLTVKGTGTYDINGVTYNGTFNFTTQGGGVNGETAAVTFSDTDMLAVTPEPNSLLLMGTGLVGAGAVLLRRRRGADLLA